jgi:hypothetical protein
MSTNDFEYMKEAMAADLAEFLSNDLELTIPEALDILYNSETYLKLSDPNTGLYFQSTLYVYSYLQQEISTGKIA